jgi:hypothetical protein
VSFRNGILIEPRFAAMMSGDEEVPPVVTEATGTADFRRVGADRLAYAVSVQNLRRITEAHVHKGRRGENGPVVAWLFGPSSGTDITGLLAAGTIRRGDLVGPLKGRRIRDLVRLMRTGRAYANVHTVQNPEGEIRGQIRRAGRVALPVRDPNAWREGSWTRT